jgi:hypothetical protein
VFERRGYFTAFDLTRRARKIVSLKQFADIKRDQPAAKYERSTRNTW